ncbi:MAG: hypothetical protein BGO28_03985 [Alphaproteobacteria bacterium 43-37]|nr:MAG: hypothetical protein BGO28_03985 [Alphaproteobacteria bacterium 43-37]
MQASPNNIETKSPLERKIDAGLYFAFIACGHPGVYLSFLYCISGLKLSTFNKISPYAWIAAYVAYALVIYYVWRRTVVFALSFFKKFDADIFLNNKKTRSWMDLCIALFYTGWFLLLLQINYNKIEFFLGGFAFIALLILIIGIPIIALFFFTVILFVFDIYFAFRKKA